MFKVITSSSNPYIKHIIKIRKDRKYRNQEKKFLVIGKKILSDVKNLDIDTLVTTDKNIKKTSAKNILVVTSKIMKKITNVENPENIAALVNFFELPIKAVGYVLILDDISDPGNLGTMIRSASAFDFDLIICSTNCTDPFSEKALRSAKGSTFLIPIRVFNEKEIISFINSHKLTPYLADIQGSSIDKIAYKTPLALIVSNEAKGPSFWAKKISKKITIPIKNVDSLNAAIAAGICMHTIKK